MLVNGLTRVLGEGGGLGLLPALLISQSVTLVNCSETAGCFEMELVMGLGIGQSHNASDGGHGPLTVGHSMFLSVSTPKGSQNQ